jgi:serine/threonine-protein kinase
MSLPGETLMEMAHARVGTTLRGKWRLDRLLGVGGMAAVYAGTHRNGARGAIKVLHLAVSLDPEARKRFLREGYVANAVGHPGSVQVLDDDVAEDGAAFLVMELLEGESVDALAERRGGRLPPEEVLAVADRLLDVLVAAHAKGIIHRDIKPDNLFLTADGRLKLLDFGIARLRDGNAKVTMTVDGASFGTPAFMAPEQALGRTEEIDARADVFGVGATMFSLLTGRFVHVTRTLNEQLVAQASRPPPPLASVAPDVPAAVAAVVDRALTFEKEHRWPDARLMREAIHVAQQALGRGPGLPPAAPGWGAAGSAPRNGQAATVAPSVQAARLGGGGSSTVLVGALAGTLCVLAAIVVLRLTGGLAAAPGPATPSAAAAASAPPAIPAPPPASAAPPPASAAPPPAPAATPSTTATAPEPSPPDRPPPARPATPPRKPATPAKPRDSWLDRQH